MGSIMPPNQTRHPNANRTSKGTNQKKGNFDEPIGDFKEHT